MGIQKYVDRYGLLDVAIQGYRGNTIVCPPAKIFESCTVNKGSHGRIYGKEFKVCHVWSPKGCIVCCLPIIERKVGQKVSEKFQNQH